MLLTIDIGNTNITLGVYDNHIQEACWRLATNNEKMPDEYGIQILNLIEHSGIGIDQIEGVCLASVVPPLTSKIFQACSNYLKQKPFLVDHTTNLGIEVLYDDISTIGTDRLVDALAVKTLYDCPACVVDFGTATTFDAIDAKGQYLGGAIAPGIAIAGDALVQHTAKLPRVDLQRPPSVIGKNTVHAMQSGLLFGYVSMVEGMVNRFKKELGEHTNVIATGGLAEIISNESNIIDVVAPWLTLDGLRIIWEKFNLK